MTISDKIRHHITKIVFLAGVFGLVACGAYKPTHTELADESTETAQSEITIALPNQTPSNVNTASMILVAGNPSARSAKICQLDSDQRCQNAISAQYLKSTGKRNIFYAEDAVQIKDQLVLEVSITYEDGSSKRQLSRIRNAGNAQNGTQGTRWKTILMASDQGNQGAWISAFDNARVKLKEIIMGMGVSALDVQEFSLHPSKQTDSVAKTTVQNFLSAVRSLSVANNPGQACLIHMTSHGSPDGFNIGYERIAARDLAQALDTGCGDQPTVLLISACYSGKYVLDSSGLLKPNRIILTAARHDRTSFGCSPEAEYTYWDGCLIDELPTAATFSQLARSVEACIKRKEGRRMASYPQSFIGDAVKSLKLVGKDS